MKDSGLDVENCPPHLGEPAGAQDRNCSFRRGGMLSTGESDSRAGIVSKILFIVRFRLFEHVSLTGRRQGCRLLQICIQPPAQCMKQRMCIDQKLRRNWRKSWLGSIRDFADVETQRLMWHDASNTNPHYSFAEYICSYFDDLGLSDDGFRSALESGLVSAREIAAVDEFHRIADRYESPTSDTDHHAILADPLWLEVVAAAQRAKRSLFDLLDDPRERGILAGP